MDCSHNRLCRRKRKESAALLKKTMLRPNHGVRRRGPQTNNEPRPHDRQFRLEPGLTGSDLAGRRFLMNPSLATLFELKMFHCIGDVNVRAVDPRIGQGAVKQSTRRTNEGTSRQILSIARLLSHQHNPRGGRALSEDSLRSGAIQVAALTLLSGPLQLLQAGCLRDEGPRARLVRNLRHITHHCNHAATPNGERNAATGRGKVVAMDEADRNPTTITRRECVSVLALGIPLIDEIAQPVYAAASANTVPLSLRINGAGHRIAIDPRVTLLDLLRERLGLTGTKKGCDHGQCGACTVLVNGRRINSCLSLAASHDGDDVTTIEGLAHSGELEPIQAAFIEHDGFQCGYCTPGQICSAVALLSEVHRGDASFVTPDPKRLEPPELTDDEIRERMSGNICRCGAYPGIVAAVKAVGGGAGSAARREL
jgi:xanthine dehydrogenase YagT iron-sulfur-binding subunit